MTRQRAASKLARARARKQMEARTRIRLEKTKQQKQQQQQKQRQQHALRGHFSLLGACEGLAPRARGAQPGGSRTRPHERAILRSGPHASSVPTASILRAARSTSPTLAIRLASFISVARFVFPPATPLRAIARYFLRRIAISARGFSSLPLTSFFLAFLFLFLFLFFFFFWFSCRSP
jgi:hypothetical protein